MLAELGLSQRVRNERHFEAARAYSIDREAHAIDRNRALFCDESGEGRLERDRHPERLPDVAPRAHCAHAVDMPRDQVASERFTHPNGALEMQRRFDRQSPESRPGESLRRRVDFEAPVHDRVYREANPVDGDG
jgi:hypothetical protein